MRVAAIFSALAAFLAVAQADVIVGNSGPTALVTGQEDAENLAVDDKYIYWSEGFGRALLRAPKQGGGATILDASGPVYAIALVGEQLLYSTPEGVKGISRDGRSKRLLVSVPHGLVGGLAVDGQRLLLVDDDFALFEAPVGGGAASRLGPKAAKLFVDRDGVYFSPYRGTSISFLQRSRGLATVLVKGEHLPLDIVADKQFIYWIGDAGETLKRASRQGSGVTTLAKGGLLFALTSDRDAIYWVRRGSLMRYRKADGSIAELARSHGTRSLALDEEFVYFADHRIGVIARVPK
jgi:hypothetical protein